MTRFRADDVSFMPPEGWEDRSITAFALPQTSGPGPAPNIVLTRDRLAEGETLARYADKQLVTFAKSLSDFELASRQVRTVGGVEGTEMVFTWRADPHPIQQQQVYLAPNPPVVLSFTFTARADVFADLVPSLDAFWASVVINPSE